MASAYPESNVPDRPERAWSLWLAVGGLFGAMGIAWFVLFSLAAENPVETVPLEHVAEPGR